MLKLNKHIYGVGGRYTQTKACQKCKCNRKNVLPPEIKFILLPNILSVKLLMHGFHKRCVYIYYMVVGFLQCKDIYIYILFVVQKQTKHIHPPTGRWGSTPQLAEHHQIVFFWLDTENEEICICIYIYMQMYDIYIYIQKCIIYIHICKCIKYLYLYM